MDYVLIGTKLAIPTALIATIDLEVPVYAGIDFSSEAACPQIEKCAQIKLRSKYGRGTPNTSFSVYGESYTRLKAAFMAGRLPKVFKVKEEDFCQPDELRDQLLATLEAELRH